MVSIKKPLPNIFQQYLKASENVLQQPIPLAAKQYTKTKCMNCNWHTNLQSNKDKGNLYLIYLSGDQFLLFFFLLMIRIPLETKMGKQTNEKYI